MSCVTVSVSGDVVSFTINNETETGYYVSVSRDNPIQMICTVNGSQSAVVHIKKFFDSYHFTMTNNEELDDDLTGLRDRYNLVPNPGDAGLNVYKLIITSTSICLSSANVMAMK